jgi:23S rRNA (adenine2503-C2)-methyltransferase
VIPTGSEEARPRTTTITLPEATFSASGRECAPPRLASSTPASPLSPSPEAPLLLTGLTTAQIEEFVAALGLPRYRGRQVADWIYRRNAGSFEEMTDLPRALRHQLAAVASVGRPEVVARTVDADGTTKYLVRLGDGQTVECVWLPYREWSSVCLSTQVGCPMACAFCATGRGGFARNLSAGEIVAQFLLARAHAPCPVTHAVFMGMGEPLLNTSAVLQALHLLNSECGIGARNLTLSTVGIVPGIQRLAREKLQINLALSLHAPDDETRARFMPVAQHFPLPVVLAALRDYTAATHRRVTLEYLLIAGVNDSPAHADRLADLVLGKKEEGGPLLAVVNLIPYNETEAGFRRPSEEGIRRFMARLKQRGVAVTRRLERGETIAAACGQLRREAASDAPGARPRRSPRRRGTAVART